MYLISISFHTESPIFDQVLDAVRNHLCPDLDRSGLFSSIIISQILLEIDPATRSFALQMQTPDLQKGLSWIENEATAFFGSLHQLYGERVMTFTTPMEIIG